MDERIFEVAFDPAGLGRRSSLGEEEWVPQVFGLTSEKRLALGVGVGLDKDRGRGRGVFAAGCAGRRWRDVVLALRREHRWAAGQGVLGGARLTSVGGARRESSSEQQCEVSDHDERSLARATGTGPGCGVCEEHGSGAQIRAYDSVRGSVRLPVTAEAAATAGDTK